MLARGYGFNPEGTVVRASHSGPVLWALCSASARKGEIRGLLRWGWVEVRLQEEAGVS